MNEQILALIYWLVGAAATITFMVVGTYVIIVRRIDENKKDSDIMQEKILSQIKLGNNNLQNWNLVITQQIDTVNDKTENLGTEVKELKKRYYEIKGKIETIETLLK